MSEFKGLRIDQKSHRWQARITVNKKRISLGYFDTEIEAAIAYDVACVKYFGGFARPNFKQ